MTREPDRSGQGVTREPDSSRHDVNSLSGAVTGAAVQAGSIGEVHGRGARSADTRVVTGISTEVPTEPGPPVAAHGREAIVADLLDRVVRPRHGGPRLLFGAGGMGESTVARIVAGGRSGSTGGGSGGSARSPRSTCRAGWSAWPATSGYAPGAPVPEELITAVDPAEPGRRLLARLLDLGPSPVCDLETIFRCLRGLASVGLAQRPESGGDVPAVEVHPFIAEVTGAVMDALPHDDPRPARTRRAAVAAIGAATAALRVGAAADWPRFHLLTRTCTTCPRRSAPGSTTRTGCGCSTA